MRSNQFNMFRSLVRIALRNIFRDLSYSIINVLGLTIGITGSLLLILYVFDELSYDRYNDHAYRIYRISSRITETDDAFNWAVTQMPLAAQLKTDYPEVEESTRLIQSGRHLFDRGESEFFEEEVSYADSNIFRVFSYKFIEGDPRTALTEPNSIVLTRSFSKRYFGSESPLGKTIDREDNQTYNVTGLIEDVPSNSNYRFSALISACSLPKDFGGWGSFHMYTYVLLQEGFDYKTFEAKLPMMYKNHMAEIFERMGIKIVYEVLPILRIHLHSDFEGEPVPVGNISYVHIFIAIIFLMLLIASINYMNLATARSTRRAREIGIRKVSGSSRVALMRQFLTESVILAIIALIISLGLCFLLLPMFNNISGKEIDLLYLTKPGILLSIIGMVVFTGLVGGSYPAFFLSSFKPTNILKGVSQVSGSNLSVRKILVVLQFTLSTAMVISTWIVYDQLNYLKNKDVGFKKDNVVILQLTTEEMSRKLPVFKSNLLSNPHIISVGSANTRIGYGSGKIIFRVETPEGMVERGINFFEADQDFIKTVGIKLIAGRDFSIDRPEDTARAVIINETLAKRLNWDDPLGKKVQFERDTVGYAEVVGLIADYFQFGLYNQMESIMLVYYPTNYVVFIKVSGEDLPGTIKFIEEQWKALYPGFPFNHSFLDESFNEQFKADEKRGIIFTFFSVLTVLIACLGLFGLASFVAEMKTKEIGIRKVHGADVNSIVSLMLRSFMVLIIISIIIACIASYFFAKDWLESFVYRTDIRWISFVSAAALTLVITIITVSLHTWRASAVNPAESLRYE